MEDEEEEEVVGEEGEFDEEAAPLDMSKVKYEGSAACEEEPLNMSAKRIKTSSNKMSSGTINFGRNGNVNGNGTGRSTPSNGIGERWIHQSRNAAASPAPSKITAILEDDDEDDDEDNDLPLGDRLSEANGNYDPERLKAFNVSGARSSRSEYASPSTLGPLHASSAVLIFSTNSVQLVESCHFSRAHIINDCCESA